MTLFYRNSRKIFKKGVRRIKIEYINMKRTKKDFNELWVEHSDIGIEKLLKSLHVFKGVSWAEYGVGGRTCLELESNGSGNVIINNKTVFSFNNLKELALKSDELNDKYPFKIG